VIDITNLQKSVRIPRKKIIKLVKDILVKEEKQCYDVSFAFVTDRMIKKLNKRFLHRNFATDVISFPLEGNKFLGEIVISTERAIIEAKRRVIPVEKEILFYCIHGLLHLLGYTHKEMKKLVSGYLLKSWI
jgi:probable rRNA maturation factor